MGYNIQCMFLGLNPSKIFVVFAIIAGLTLGGFCVKAHADGNMDMSGVRKSEKFTQITQAEQPCCGSSISQYTNSLRNITASIPNHTRDILSVIFGLILSLAISGIFVGTKSQNEIKFSTLQKLYLNRDFDPPIFNQLRLAFSRGIINSKVF